MPIITLSTDIGQQDYIVGAIKGQLLQSASNVSIADITHYLLPFNYAHAAYVCSNAFKYYPVHTFHIVLLDVFSGNNKFVIASIDNQFVICPDNGLISLIFGKLPKAFKILPFPKQANILSVTQIIADAIAQTTTHGWNVEVNESEKLTERFPLKPTVGNNWMEGQILFIDHFDNVIINITKEEFEATRDGRRFKILFKRDESIDSIKEHYGSVNESEMVAFFNSAGYLEIAINKGNIAGLFGLKRYNEKAGNQLQNTQYKWFYHTVKIYFE